MPAPRHPDRSTPARDPAAEPAYRARPRGAAHYASRSQGLSLVAILTGIAAVASLVAIVMLALALAPPQEDDIAPMLDVEEGDDLAPFE